MVALFTAMSYAELCSCYLAIAGVVLEGEEEFDRSAKPADE